MGKNPCYNPSVPKAQEAVLEQSMAFLLTKGAILIPLTLSTSHIKLP